MKSQFDHNLMSSFYLWFDNRLTELGEAVITGETQVFKYSASGLNTPSNMYAFYSSANQFYTEGSGSQSGVMSEGIMLYQDGTGVIIDNDKGRILLSKTYGNELPLSGFFTQKEINVYTTNETEEEILTRNEFYLESGESYSETMDQLAKAKYYIPCVFLSNSKTNNEGFALGGLKDTKNLIKALVFASSLYQLDAILGIFRDSAERCFNIIDQKDFPYGKYWSMKIYPYDYGTYVESHKIDNTFINKVSCYKLKENAQSKIRKDIFIGYIDFEISSIRMS